MNTGRTLLAIIGLVAIALAYLTANLYFLILAVVVFFIGLYIMGAMRRSSESRSKSVDKASKQKYRKQN